MNIQEPATVYAENLDVKIMIMNNQTLGLVAQMEDRFYHARRGNTSLEIRKAGRPYPDFALIAKGYGIPSRTVSRKEEAEDAIRTMLETPGPFLLDCQIGYHEHVLPMIPSGGTYRDIIEQ